MDDKIIPFKPRAAKQAGPVAPIPQDGTLFWMDHELTEVTLTIPQADPTPPRVRY